MADNILYKDVILSKKLNSNGSLVEINNENSLAQAISLWLTSGKGERIRDTSGGWGVWGIGKELSDANAKYLKNQILLGLETDFSPTITVTECEVYPDLKHSRWIITIKGYCAGLNVGVNTVTAIQT